MEGQKKRADLHASGDFVLLSFEEEEEDEKDEGKKGNESDCCWNFFSAFDSQGKRRHFVFKPNSKPHQLHLHTGCVSSRVFSSLISL